MIRELAALKDCSGHENIVQLQDVFRVKGSGRVIISLKLEEGGTLGSLLHAKNRLHAKWSTEKPRRL